MASTTIRLSADSRKSLVKHPAVRQAARMIRAADICFPDTDDDRFGDAAGEAITNCQKALGICGGALADEVLETVMRMAL